MPLHQTDNQKTVKTGIGSTADYPDVVGIATAEWRWVSKKHGIFETKTPLAGVKAAPATYPGVFAVAKKRSNGQVLTGGVGIHDNEHNIFAVVCPEGTFPSEEIIMTECKEGDANAVCVLAKQPVVPSDNDLDWQTGVPKVPTAKELVPQIESLSDDELVKELQARGVDVQPIK